MQEQNFEKQVRQKMEELSFSPSDPVWKKVEEQIRKKKDRRRIFFWLLPFALLGTGIYFYMDSNYMPATMPVTVNGPSSSIQKKDSGQKHTAIKDNVLKPSINHQSTPAKQKISFSKQIVTSHLSFPKQKTFFEKNLNSFQETEVKQADSIQTQLLKEIAIEERAEDKKIAEDRLIEPADRIITPKQNMKIEDTVNKNPVPPEKLIDTTAVAQTDKTDSAETPQVNTYKKKNRWDLTAYLAAGISGIATSPLGNLSTGGAASFDALRYYNSASPVTNGAGPGGQFTASMPSDIKSGFSFATGIGLNKALSTRLKFSTGMQYHFFTTSTTVGKRVDSMNTVNRENKNIPITNYYRSDNSIQAVPYKNHYHFLELPIGIDWQVLKNTSLHIQTGVSIEWLITTSALYYDSQKSIYYVDKDVFTPIQFSFYTGISYRIIKMETASLYIGPKVQFQLSNLLDKKEYGQQHLYFTGISTYLSF